MHNRSHLVITVPGDDRADSLRSLRAWLIDEAGLRGRVELVEQVPQEGTLGPLLDSVLASAGSGGAIIGLSAALISWIRHRSGEVDLKIAKADGTTIEISARRVRGLDADGLRAEIDQLRQALDG